jgi:hypothetical protein
MAARSLKGINNVRILKSFIKNKNKIQQSVARHWDTFLKTTIAGKAAARKIKAL